MRLKKNTCSNIFSALVACLLSYVLPPCLKIIRQICSNSLNNAAQNDVDRNLTDIQPKNLIDILISLFYISIVGFELLNYYQMFGINQSQLEKLAQSFNTDILFEQLYEKEIKGNYLFEFLIQIKQIYSLVFVLILLMLFGISFRRIAAFCSNKLVNTSIAINMINILSNIVEFELYLTIDLIFNFLVMYFSLNSLLNYTQYSMIRIINYCENISV